MTKEQIQSLALKEAEKLRKFATEEERVRLDFDKLLPDTTRRCIYGQMTGDCYGWRAFILLSKCCVPLSDSLRKDIISPYMPLFYAERGRPFSPLEYYTHNYPESNANIIALIKGETETLKFV